MGNDMGINIGNNMMGINIGNNMGDQYRKEYFCLFLCILVYFGPQMVPIIVIVPRWSPE